MEKLPFLNLIVCYELPPHPAHLPRLLLAGHGQLCPEPSRVFQYECQVRLLITLHTRHTKLSQNYFQVPFLFEENIVHNVSTIFKSLQKELVSGKFIIWG